MSENIELEQTRTLPMPEIKISQKRQPAVVNPYQIRDNIVDLLSSAANEKIPGMQVLADIDIPSEANIDSLISVKCTRMANIAIDGKSQEYAKIYFQIDMKTPADSPRERENHVVYLLEILNDINIGDEYPGLKVSDAQLWWRKIKGDRLKYVDEESPKVKYSLISVDASCIIER